MVEYGTGPHKEPRRKVSGQISRRKKAMLINGEFYHSVEHPGTKPQPFLRPAYARLKSNLNRTYPNHIGNRIIRGMAQSSKGR